MTKGKLETVMTEKPDHNRGLQNENFCHQHNPNLNNMQLFQSTLLYAHKFDPHQQISDDVIKG